MSDIIFPKALKKGDTIAIISPATVVDPTYVAGATKRLEECGYKVKVMPHACGPADGSYASSLEHRLDDLHKAYNNKEVRALLCARGGYGCVHLIDSFSVEELQADPKWIIGFSDVSALHAMMHRAGIASIHASMAKHLTLFPDDHVSDSLLKILSSPESLIQYSCEAESRNIAGEAEGELVGGNLAVLDGLCGTDFDLLNRSLYGPAILFIEDISEAIYRTERMVRRLALSGALQAYKGIVVGQFTDSRPDLNYPSTADMLRERLPLWGVKDVPVAFNFPCGHIDGNLPLIEGAKARLQVEASLTTLTMQQPAS